MYLLISSFKQQLYYSYTGLHHLTSSPFPLLGHFWFSLSKAKQRKEVFMFRDAMPELVAVLSQNTRGQRELSWWDTKVVRHRISALFLWARIWNRLLVGIEKLLQSGVQEEGFQPPPGCCCCQKPPSRDQGRSEVLGTPKPKPKFRDLAI